MACAPVTCTAVPLVVCGWGAADIQLASAALEHENLPGWEVRAYRGCWYALSNDRYNKTLDCDNRG